MLDDEDKGVRQSALLALARINTERSIDYLLAASNDEEVYSYALKEMHTFDDPRVFPALVAALEHTSGSIRQSAARGLGDLHDARAIPYLIEALNDADNGVVSASMQSLGKLGATEAIPALTLLLTHRMRWMREKTAVVLEELSN